MARFVICLVPMLALADQHCQGNHCPVGVNSLLQKSGGVSASAKNTMLATDTQQQAYETTIACPFLAVQVGSGKLVPNKDGQWSRDQAEIAFDNFIDPLKTNPASTAALNGARAAIIQIFFESSDMNDLLPNTLAKQHLMHTGIRLAGITVNDTVWKAPCGTELHDATCGEVGGHLETFDKLVGMLNRSDPDYVWVGTEIADLCDLAQHVFYDAGYYPLGGVLYETESEMLTCKGLYAIGATAIFAVDGDWTTKQWRNFLVYSQFPESFTSWQDFQVAVPPE